MFSPEEQVHWYLQSTFAYTTVNLGLSAIQAFMWTYLVILCIEATPETRKRRLPYLSASLVILLLSSASAILRGLHVYTVLLEVTPGLNGVEAMIQISNAAWARLVAPANLLGDLAIRIADAVLVYRCYIVWVNYPWVPLVPALLWLAATGVNLRTYISFGFWNETLNAVGVSLTVGLNILITLLITFRLIRAHKRLSIALPNTNHRLYFGIVAILVESAAPIGIFGVGVIVTRLLSKSSDTAWKAAPVFNILYDAAAILGPQLIIFRVATGVSWTNKTETSAAFSRGIAFVEPGQTKFDSESIQARYLETHR
ncbi:hypothetical protein BKA70DRAFT_1481490 [Coprinopsis sp. MPI-PUGE-AT-0042]|nr:hypothetical protein BKA70DRAFT_1481490 [Coprinopsis sp. MPI-PUGE-AT-0042]